LGIIPLGFYDTGKGEPRVVSLNPITAGQFLLDWPGLHVDRAASIAYARNPEPEGE
jgi:hypothetical protein